MRTKPRTIPVLRQMVGKLPTNGEASSSAILKRARSRRYLEAHRDEINRRRKERRRLAKIGPPIGGASLVEVALSLRISLCEAFTLQTETVRRLRESVLLSNHEIYQYPIDRWIRVARILMEEGLYAEATEIMVQVKKFSYLLWSDSAISYLDEVSQPVPGIQNEEAADAGDGLTNTGEAETCVEPLTDPTQ